MTTGRNSDGTFQKGAHLFGKSNGIKNGRKKTLATEVKDALKIAEDAMPQIFQSMLHDALDESLNVHERQACREYLADRIYGKPNQPLSGGKGLILKVIYELADTKKAQ